MVWQVLGAHIHFHDPSVGLEGHGYSTLVFTTPVLAGEVTGTQGLLLTRCWVGRSQILIICLWKVMGDSAPLCPEGIGFVLANTGSQ